MGYKRSYHSKKALGVLYDRVASVNVDYIPSCEDRFDQRITEKFYFDDGILATARDIKVQYDMAVRRLLKQFCVETEFELYSGWAMTKPSIGSDYKRQEDLGQQFDSLKQRFRETCIAAAGEVGSNGLNRMAAAMYKVTEEDVKLFLAKAEAEGENLEYSARDMPLISFPWLFHWVLVMIAMGTGHQTTLAAVAAPLAPGGELVKPQRLQTEEALVVQNVGESSQMPVATKESNEVSLMDFDNEPIRWVPEVKPEMTVDPEESFDDETANKVSMDNTSEEPRLEHLTIKESAADRLLRLLDSDSDSD